MVCWAVIGAGFESLTRNKGKVISLLTGIFAASISFGLYHFAHSPPFNQIHMVLLMMIVSFATSIVYFIGRDIYAAIVFHNTLALFGVMQALEKSGNLISYSQPVYPLIVILIIIKYYAIYTFSVNKMSTIMTYYYEHKYVKEYIYTF